MTRIKILLAMALLAGGAVTLSLVPRKSAVGNASRSTASLFSLTDGHSSSQVHNTYGQLPLAFEPNVGQTDPRVRFMARGSKYGLFLTDHEAVLKLANASSALQMGLAGSNPNAQVSGTDILPGKSNYLIGRDPSRWHQGISQFARVRYNQVYPGIDLVYYGRQGKLEYDFEVAPGADPKQVALNFQGADKLSLDANGDLILAKDGGQIRFEAPRVYQRDGKEQQLVSGKFVLLANQQVGFEIGNYDRSHELVIDPQLSYSTYLGGSGDELMPSIAVDSASNAYIAGTTTSADFPIPAGSTPFQLCLDDPNQPQPTSCTSASNSDAFIVKLDPSGRVIQFATFLGGNGTDSAAGVAVDSGFNVVVVGTTLSTNFPVANGFQNAVSSAANGHVFVSELDALGEHLLYSTYLAGTVSTTTVADKATGVAVDTKNKIYVTGTTTASDFPVTPDGFQTASRGNTQFFLSKIDPATSGNASLAYSTYFGGGNPTNGVAVGGGITVDTSGNVYFTGTTNFIHTGGNAATDFPILNASQSCLDGPTNPAPCPTGVTATDAFIAKLNPTNPIGSHLVYSTYFGGSGDDIGTGVAVDSGGNAYITGTTDSADILIPTVNTVVITPFQQCLGVAANPLAPAVCTTAPGNDAFVAKFGNFTTGTTTLPAVAVTYFSYLGGSGDDEGLAIAVDSAQRAHITGSTTSADFHTLNPVQPILGGATDAFFATIDTTATSQTAASHNSTYLGGSGIDRGTGIAVDLAGSSYVVGETASGNFPLATPIQNALKGQHDAFVTKYGPVVSLSMTATATPNPVGVGSPVTFAYTITNNGDFVPSITFVSNIPSNATAGTAASSTGNCTTVVNNSITCTLAGLNSAGTTTISIPLTPGSLQTPPGPPTSYSFGASANIIAPGAASASANVTVNDFALSLSPNSATVTAGQAATYMATVTPTGSIPGSVSLACAGLPTGASCTVANGSITSLTAGPQSRALVVNTTERTTTTAGVRPHGAIYAVWLPVSGVAFLGLGIGGTMSRKRRAFLGVMLGAFFILIFLQPGCGSQNTTSTTTGTPAGTYTFTVTATSGTVAHSQPAQVVVQ